MKFPGQTAIAYDDSGGDHERAAWLLGLIDQSPDRLAWIAIPRTDTDEQLDAVEAKLLAAYEIAKSQRPDLSVQLVPKVLDSGLGDSQGAFVVHEHHWVGGHCVRGCRETRETA